MMLAFGPFTIDTERRAAYKNGAPLRLTLKCAELLIALASNPGAVLSKQELLEAAWPDPQASDATLAQHIFLLRRALRHDGIDWICTIPNIGYRFTAEVRTLDAGADERTKAVETYLQGARTMRDIGTERALRSAIDLCTHAIALDERAADAYALRACCWRLLAQSMYAEPLPCLESANADAAAALCRDAQHAGAHVEAALSGALVNREGAAAARHLAAAQRIDADHPLLPYARVTVALICGNRDEALRIARDAGSGLHANVLYACRDFAAASSILQRRQCHGAALVIRGACALREGDYAAALDDFYAVYYADGADEGRGVPSVRHYALGMSIYTLAKMGRLSMARERVRELDKIARRRYVSPMARAIAYLGLGEIASAIALVEDALRRYDPWSAYIAVDPMLDELRVRPDFSVLTRDAA